MSARNDHAAHPADPEQASKLASVKQQGRVHKSDETDEQQADQDLRAPAGLPDDTVAVDAAGQGASEPVATMLAGDTSLNESPVWKASAAGEGGGATTSNAAERATGTSGSAGFDLDALTYAVGAGVVVLGGGLMLWRGASNMPGSGSGNGDSGGSGGGTGGGTVATKMSVGGLLALGPASAGLLITAYDRDGQVIDSALTDAQGHYALKNISTALAGQAITLVATDADPTDGIGYVDEATGESRDLVGELRTTLVLGSASDQTASITPLTELATRQLVGTGGDHKLATDQASQVTVTNQAIGRLFGVADIVGATPQVIGSGSSLANPDAYRDALALMSGMDKVQSRQGVENALDATLRTLHDGLRTVTVNGQVEAQFHGLDSAALALIAQAAGSLGDRIDPTLIDAIRNTAFNAARSAFGTSATSTTAVFISPDHDVVRSGGQVALTFQFDNAPDATALATFKGDVAAALGGALAPATTDWTGDGTSYRLALTDDSNSTAPLTLSLPSDRYLANDLRVTVDATAPKVTGLQVSGLTGQPAVRSQVLRDGDTLRWTLTLDEFGQVHGAPRLEFFAGTKTAYADFVASASSSQRLVFDYVVQPDDNAIAGAADPNQALRANRIILPAGSDITDTAGNSYHWLSATDLSNANAGLGGALSHLSLDTTAPTLNGGTELPLTGTTIGTAQADHLTLHFSEAVKAGGHGAYVITQGTTEVLRIAASAAQVGADGTTVTVPLGRNLASGSYGVSIEAGTVTDLIGNAYAGLAADATAAWTFQVGSVNLSIDSVTADNILNASEWAAASAAGKLVVTGKISGDAALISSLGDTDLGLSLRTLADASGARLQAIATQIDKGAGTWSAELPLTRVPLAEAAQLLQATINTSGVQSNATRVWTVDTQAQISLGMVSGDNRISALERQIIDSGRDLNINYRAEVGARGTLSFITGGYPNEHVVTKTFDNASGGVDSVKLTKADLAVLGSGTVYLTASTTDAAGNVHDGAATTSFDLAPSASSTSSVTLTSLDLVNVPVSGGYHVGDRIQIDARFSGKVSVQGIGLQAQLLLGDGNAATARNASLIGISDDGLTLHFAYLVRPGDTDSDGLALPADALRLAGSRLIDELGMAPGLGNPAVTARAAAYVDTTASQPDLRASAATGTQGGTVALSISAALVDTDGSETLSAISLSGLPEGSVLSSGTTVIHPNSAGIYSITAAQLPGLALTPPANYSGSFTLHASVSATEIGVSLPAVRSVDLPVTVTAVSTPGDHTPPTASTTESPDIVDRGVLDLATADTLRVRFSEAVRLADIRAAIAGGTVTLTGADGSPHHLGTGWTLDAYTPDKLVLKGFGNERVNGAFTSLWDSTLNGGKGGNTLVPTFSSDYALGSKTAFAVDSTSVIYTHTDASGGVWYLWRQAGWSNYVLSKADAPASEWYISSLSSPSNTSSREVTLGVASWFERTSAVSTGTDPWASASRLDEALVSGASGAVGRTFLLGLGSGSTATGGDVLTLATGAVHDIAGNASTAPISFTLPADMIRPTLSTSAATELTGLAADGSTVKTTALTAGDHVRVTLHLAEPVRVSTNALPGVTLTLDNGTREALLDRNLSFTASAAADGYRYSSSLVFDYVVQAGDSIAAGGLTLGSFNRHNSNTFDAAGNRYTPANDLPDPVNSVAIAADTTAPYLWGSYANGRTVTLTASEALDAGHPPPPSAFSALVDGHAVEVTDVHVGTGNQSHALTLTLATALTTGQSVTISYQDPTPGVNDLDALQDKAGNDVSPSGSFQASITATAAPQVRFVAYDGGALEVANPGDIGVSGGPSELRFHVEFDNAVQVSGTPRLALQLTDDTGVTHTVQADFQPYSNVSSWGQTSLSFVYTLQPGDRGSVHLASSSIDLNGGLITASGSGGAAAATLALPASALPFTGQSWVYGAAAGLTGTVANDLLTPWITDPSLTPLNLGGITATGGAGTRDTLLVSIALPDSVDTRVAASGWHLAYGLAADNTSRQVQLLDGADQVQRTYDVPTDAAWPSGIEQLAYHLMYRDTRGHWQFTGDGEPLLLARSVTESVDVAGTDVFVQGSLGQDAIDLGSHASAQRILVLAGPGNDTITGHAGVDIVAGQGGKNLIDTGAGDDTVIVGRGQDTIDGGDGTDTLRLTLPGWDHRVVDVGGALLIRSTTSTSSTDGTTWVDRYRLEPVSGNNTAGDWQVTDLALNQVVAVVSHVEQIQLRLADNASKRTNLKVSIGSSGNDTLSATALTLAGAGDDQITLANAALRLSDWQTPLQIDGGAGTDLLLLGSDVVGAYGRLDQLLQNAATANANPSRGVKRIEGIDLTGGGNNTLRLDVAQILALHDAGDDSGKNLWVSASAGQPAITNFAVKGGASSTLNLTDSGWTLEGAQDTPGGKVLYANHAANTVVVVDPAVKVVLPAGTYSYAISSQAANGSVTEGTGTGGTPVTFTITRQGDTMQASSVDWTTQTAGGMGASDFLGDVLPTGRVSFAAGETSRTVTVMLKADSLAETGESFGIVLQTGASTPPSTWVNVIDDDSGQGGGGTPTAPATAAVVTDLSVHRSTAAFPGESIKLDLTFDQEVIVTGTPTLALTIVDASGQRHALTALYSRDGLPAGESSSVATFLLSYAAADVGSVGGQIHLDTSPLLLPTGASIVGAANGITASLDTSHATPPGLTSLWLYGQSASTSATGTAGNDVLMPWNSHPLDAPGALRNDSADGGAGDRDVLVVPIVLQNVSSASVAEACTLEFDRTHLELLVRDGLGKLLQTLTVPNPADGSTAWPNGIEALRYQLVYLDNTTTSWRTVDSDAAARLLWRTSQVLVDPVTGDWSDTGSMSTDLRDASAVATAHTATFDSSPGGDVIIGHDGTDLVMPQGGAALVTTGAGNDVAYLAAGAQQGANIDLGSGGADALMLPMPANSNDIEPHLETNGSVTLSSAMGSWINNAFVPDASGWIDRYNLLVTDAGLEVRSGNGQRGDLATLVQGAERLGIVHGSLHETVDLVMGDGSGQDLSLPRQVGGLLSGGAGEDTLHVNAGGTIALGGAGNDRIVVAASAFSSGGGDWLMLDGGTGRDLLVTGNDVTGHTSTLNAAPSGSSVARSLEGFDLTSGGGAHNTLELGTAGIMALHDSNDDWNVWSPLKDNTGTADAHRLQFLVLGDGSDVLRLLQTNGEHWTEGTAISSSAYGVLKVWNGADLNGQQYQVLVAGSVGTSVL